MSSVEPTLTMSVTTTRPFVGRPLARAEDGRFVKHRLPGDTTIIHAGIAYKLF